MNHIGQPAMIPAQTAEPVEQALYEIRRKIYPRAVTGDFATARWALVWLTQLTYYGLPWLTWNDRQAVLFDLAARKFYVFGLVFWPQDIVYLTVLLIASAYALFLFTAVAGRLWCGYACPQTVYTEMFMWIERKVEGERLARIKLDRENFNARKLRVKVIKHGLWIALALWTGFTFVGYFTPITLLWDKVWSAGLGGWEAFWILFYGFATYGNAGWMREQVCKYMCPYARFQGVMFDPDTLIITYDRARGEPRGARSRNVDHKAKGLGDCVDCGICVQVCPTGIDIRNGLQYECIGCGACIDGCDQVMAKLNYPKGLIRYATENALKHSLGAGQIVRRMLRPRVLLYSSVLAGIVIVSAVTLAGRVPVKVDVIRDRSNVTRDLGDPLVQNVYRLQIMNTQERPAQFTVAVTGIDGARLLSDAQPIEVRASSSRWVPVRVEVPRANAKVGSNRIEFSIESSGERPVRIVEKTTFVVQ
jgi:cytochrome c oxidase accessory protein FixG